MGVLELVLCTAVRYQRTQARKVSLRIVTMSVAVHRRVYMTDGAAFNRRKTNDPEYSIQVAGCCFKPAKAFYRYGGT